MEKDQVILKLVDYLELRLEERLSLEEIADVMNYSKFHLNRLFSEAVGCTIYQYIKMRRLTEAAKKLVDTDKTITQIAMEANYSAQQAFTLAFKQLYDCPPQVYRAAGVFRPKQKKFTRIHDQTMMRLGGKAA